MAIMEVMMVPNGDHVLNSWEKRKRKSSRLKYKLVDTTTLAPFIATS
jgi:hypothetical protein